MRPLIVEMCPPVMLKAAKQAQSRIGQPHKLVLRDAYGLKLWAPRESDFYRAPQRWPLYNQSIKQVASFLRERFGHLVMVDVGANIGDTSLICDTGDCEFLCIEGDSRFFQALQRNTAGKDNFSILNALCGKVDTMAGASFSRDAATSRVTLNGSGSEIVYSLDTILLSQEKFTTPHFIKIDCDGHDFDIIEGAQTTLRHAQPALHFECAPNGVDDFKPKALRCFAMLRGLGYASAFFYDNYGHPLIRVPLDNTTQLASLLDYQIISDLIYYDVLTMPETMLTEFLITN